VAQDTTALKVRLERYQYIESTETLVYRNASVSSIDGKRSLLLPSSQTIGNIRGTAVTVDQLIAPRHPSKEDKNEGTISIKLNRATSNLPAYLAPTVRIMGIQPMADEMGLDVIHTRLAEADPSDFPAKTAPVVSKISSIPEIRITLRITTPTLISSQEVTVPLRHGPTPKPQPRPAFPVNIAGRPPLQEAGLFSARLKSRLVGSQGIICQTGYFPPIVMRPGRRR